MDKTEKIESLINGLPDPDGARRFFSQMSERNPAETKKLLKNEGLLSDVLALSAYSPILASTILQNPAYISWLERQRSVIAVRSKEELLESLARFSLTNSQIEPHVLLARFRRRELLSIYLRDIRKLVTIAETTEEISNLADAVLEYALRLASQELDNRYGAPLEIDRKGRSKPARFCIVSLGKLGSKELNYSSDIDLLFLYSTDGTTSGQGIKEAITNREYFIKLAEFITRIVGQQSGEGAAYRVDLRLRPHGRVGALAVSLPEAVNYYQNSAQAWERQTLIRSRAVAGNFELFKKFYSQVETVIYPKGETISSALNNVKLSKEKINLEQNSVRGYNVKLGKGGIREIEFIAQALQIAYGGNDLWLRSAHTLFSLSRLSDRKLLSETETTRLFEAYEFLRRLEHRLQMEHGLQTHLIPDETNKRLLAARRMDFQNIQKFDSALKIHTSNVGEIFERIFGTSRTEKTSQASAGELFAEQQIPPPPNSTIEISAPPFVISKSEKHLKNIETALEKSGDDFAPDKKSLSSLKKICQTSDFFGEMLSTNPKLIADLPLEADEFQSKNYFDLLFSAVEKKANFRETLAALRIEWTKLFIEIAAFDIYEKIDLIESKKLQTGLAEASIQTALLIAQKEIYRHYELKFPESKDCGNLPFAVLGLGKLGSRGMDYGSDLDLVLIYDEDSAMPAKKTMQEFYSRFVEIFVTTISSFTREGHLYRVDLRLRPDGKNGAASLGKKSFLTYLQSRSAIWEWLAYVKLRGVSGNLDLALETEREARKIVHENALKVDAAELVSETKRLRDRLEQEKTRKSKDINIKFGAGGLLDIYFAARFLQLRNNIQDEPENRSTQATLKKLFSNNCLNEENFSVLSNGHEFLNLLDHNLRLTVGRSSRLPVANKFALEIIASRMQLESANDLLENLTIHRLEIRRAFEEILS